MTYTHFKIISSGIYRKKDINIAVGEIINLYLKNIVYLK